MPRFSLSYNNTLKSFRRVGECSASPAPISTVQQESPHLKLSTSTTGYNVYTALLTYLMSSSERHHKTKIARKPTAKNRLKAWATWNRINCVQVFFNSMIFNHSINCFSPLTFQIKLTNFASILSALNFHSFVLYLYLEIRQTYWVSIIFWQKLFSTSIFNNSLKRWLKVTASILMNSMFLNIILYYSSKFKL